jgi:hypothetical protein
MMSSLKDARDWHLAAREQAGYLRRLGTRFWDRTEWAEALNQDNHFRHVDGTELQDGSQIILKDLDDLGVPLMFSVFEAIVRERALADVENSLPRRLHPAVRHAVVEPKKVSEGGAFGRVTRAFKSRDHDLVEKGDRVRRYRNRVAHGRRDDQPSAVTPRDAYDRLTEFLEKMSTAESDAAEPNDQEESRLFSESHATGRADEAATT